MKEEKANKLIKTLEKQGYKDKLYSDYSGRGMFGDTTYGVVTDIKDLSKKLFLNRDNMGLDYIFY